MAERKTIMLDKNIVKKIRLNKEKKIRDLNQSISFSQMINTVLEEGLKKF